MFALQNANPTEEKIDEKVNIFGQLLVCGDGTDFNKSVLTIRDDLPEGVSADGISAAGNLDEANSSVKWMLMPASNRICSVSYTLVDAVGEVYSLLGGEVTLNGNNAIISGDTTVEGQLSYQSWVLNLPEDDRDWRDCPANDGIENIWKYAAGLSAASRYSKDDLFVYDNVDGCFSVKYFISKRSGGVWVVPEWNIELSGEAWTSIGLTNLKVGENPTQEIWRASIPLEETGFIRLKVTLEGAE